MSSDCYFFFFTWITNNYALTYSLKYDNANKMRQCENIFVFIDLTKSIGSDRGGSGPPQTPPMHTLQTTGYYTFWVLHTLIRACLIFRFTRMSGFGQDHRQKWTGWQVNIVTNHALTVSRRDSSPPHHGVDRLTAIKLDLHVHNFCFLLSCQQPQLLL